jgi:hypothetical protein
MRVLILVEGVAGHFRFSPPLLEQVHVGLGTLLRERERDGSPTGTLTTERSGSLQERRAGVKRSRSIITLLSRKQFICLCGQGRATCRMALYLGSSLPR